MALSATSSDDELESFGGNAFNPLARTAADDEDAFDAPPPAAAVVPLDDEPPEPPMTSAAYALPETAPPADPAPQKPAAPCCPTHAAILKWLQMYPASGADAESERRNMIAIADSQKSTDMTGTSFIVYQIVALNPSSSTPLHTVLRRYSEFESLRKSLQRIHPTVVVPPIPEKHTLADYATKQSRTKDDPTVIAKRKRMLASFLNRVVRHPILGADHMVHGFLEPGSWNEVLAKAVVPKSSSGGPLKKVLGKGTLISPDPHWINAESYTSQFHASISHAHRTSRAILTNLDGTQQVLSDIAAQYNAWSLSEPPLGAALERIGQAQEATGRATARLRQGLESSFAEPLQEQAQLAQSVDKVLQWRRARNVEWEGVLAEIEGKRSQLQSLERTEQEATRVQQGLQRGSTAFAAPAAPADPEAAAATFPPPAFPPTATASSSSDDPSEHPLPALPPAPVPSRTNTILSTLNSLIDNDPAATRRSSIARTREKILSLSEKRDGLQAELAESGVAIQRDLDRYQREKMAELKSIMLGFAREMREWSRKAAQSWEEAKAEVERVEL